VNLQTHIILTETNFRKKVLLSKQPMIVEFGADSCGQCQIFYTMIEGVVTDLKGKIKVGKLDVNDNESIAKEYGIRDLPTLLLFNGGQIVDHIVGVISKKDLKNRIEVLLKEE